MPDWLGKTIGKVRIEELLAKGGMAEVYLGSHLTLDRPVAVKVLHSYIEEEPILLERFHREAKVVAGLRHPNIVQIFDFDTIDGHPYIVMEYLNGPTLATYLRYLHQRKKRIPSDQVARLLKELTAALDYAHRFGVIHRDIKPGNILLHSRSADIPLDKPLANDVGAIVTDFGLVRVMHTASQTAAGFISGTPAYMSPEQARGDQIDHRTDIYALGIVLYEMLAGRVPFEADSTMTILHMQVHTPPPPIPGIPARVQAVLDRALQKNPDDRYQTSQEMAEDFYRSIDMTTQAEPVRAPYPERTVPTEATIEVPVSLPPKPTPAELQPPQKRVPLKPELSPQPARNRIWIGIGVGLLSLVLLSLLVVGALRLLPNSIQPAGTSSPVTPNTSTSPLPSETLVLPAAEGMVEVAAGTYEVGLTTADEYHIAAKTIDLNNFWIDKYLTINADYQNFISQTSTPPPEVWPWPDKGDHPVRGVTWDQAVAYCDWVEKRLPREAEWEAAGHGPGTPPQKYPWGEDASATGQVLDLSDQDTYPVGTQSFNQSPFGVFDMVGNVWEWVGEPYDNVQEGYRFLRGGRYGLPINDLAYRLAVAPGDTRYTKYAGFRCAADQVR